MTIGRSIPRYGRIAVGQRVQPDRETAEREAMRLAQTKGVGKVFVIFEAVAAARLVTVHSHTTLGGELTGEQLVPRVLDLGELDDSIPF